MEGLYGPRQRERRQAFPEMLGALTQALDRRHDISLLRGTFEELLRRIVPVRTVHLRDASSRWLTRPETIPVAESVTLDVPGDGVARGVLEATFDPGCRLGEWDFQMLDTASHVGAMVLEIERLRLQLARNGLYPSARLPRDGAAPLIGTTSGMQALRSTIERVAATDFTVLLEGESGVGKELVARQIHELSRRRKGPFVAINCAALVETLLEAELFGIEERTATGVRGRLGKFEAADGGTLFLDEVSDLSMSAQAKLLRAIQDFAVERVGSNGSHRVDIRIIAATNRGLSELVERQLFRADLFYRLSGVDVRVPTLRERKADVIELAEYFLARHRNGRTLRLSPVVSDALLAYDWPGNVRELERVMERVVTLAETDTIQLDDLPPLVRGWHATSIEPALRRNDTLRAWMRRYVRLMVDQCGGNKRKAARVLDISHHTLQTYLREPAPDVGEAPPDHRELPV
ncbi:MAG TPA: sigma-54 dependent transcriptional regulator [Vicinamibacterales bacterium]|nr:sigma-54 dependent transcriptional regulator [Vicinamibacterales bacterium]